jgi:hypothetical protein
VDEIYEAEVAAEALVYSVVVHKVTTAEDDDGAVIMLNPLRRKKMRVDSLNEL